MSSSTDNRLMFNRHLVQRHQTIGISILHLFSFRSQRFWDTTDNGLLISGISSCLTSLNFWTTILNLRSYYLTLKMHGNINVLSFCSQCQFFYYFLLERIILLIAHQNLIFPNSFLESRNRATVFMAYEWWKGFFFSKPNICLPFGITDY